jgi:hypothetical protein
MLGSWSVEDGTGPLRPEHRPVEDGTWDVEGRG